MRGPRRCRQCNKFPDANFPNVIQRAGGSDGVRWEPFAKEGIDYPSPDWHGRVLSERSEIIDSGKAAWLAADELQARLMSR